MKAPHHAFADNGYKSRKMVMSYAVLGLIFIGFALTAKYEALAVTFPEYCMALLAGAGIYVGGNMGVKYAALKSGKVDAEHPVEQKPPE